MTQTVESRTERPEALVPGTSIEFNCFTTNFSEFLRSVRKIQPPLATDLPFQLPQQTALTAHGAEIFSLWNGLSKTSYEALKRPQALAKRKL